MDVDGWLQFLFSFFHARPTREQKVGRNGEGETAKKIEILEIVIIATHHAGSSGNKQHVVRVSPFFCVLYVCVGGRRENGRQ